MVPEDVAIGPGDASKSGIPYLQLRTGKTLESQRNPSSASTSNAHNERSVIEK